jgi:HrpA-like RNA helicase
MGNPDLNGYSVIILDEAHERSLQTDILMGLLRQLQDKKPNLKIVIMSATLQIDLFTNYFKNPKLVQIPGRQFSVDILYTQTPEPDYVDAAMLTCLQLHGEEVRGCCFDCRSCYFRYINS